MAAPAKNASNPDAAPNRPWPRPDGPGRADPSARVKRQSLDRLPDLGQRGTAVELDNEGHVSCETTFGCQNLPSTSTVVEYVLGG